MNTYIVVPVYGRLQFTKRFFASVCSQISDLTFIVVDDENHHYENFTYFSSLEEERVVTLKTGGDAWWCGTVRIGLDWVLSRGDIHAGDVVVIANNDVVLPDGQFEKILTYILEDTIVHPITYSDSGEELSSGCKVQSWFPFFTCHPKGVVTSKEPIDLCTARFMCLNYSTLQKVGNIASNLVQYHGDYDFSLRAKEKGVKSYILGEVCCSVYDEDTGQKSTNIRSFRGLLKSFSSVRSSNNLKSRFSFLLNHFSKPKASLILLSMILNMFVKVVLIKVKMWLRM